MEINIFNQIFLYTLFLPTLQLFYSVNMLIDGNYDNNMHRLSLTIHFLELAHKLFIMKAAMVLDPYIESLFWANESL